MMNDPWGKRKPVLHNDPWGTKINKPHNSPWGQNQLGKIVIQISEEIIVRKVKDNQLGVGSILELKNTVDPRHVKIVLKDNSFSDGNFIELAEIDLSETGKIIPDKIRVTALDIKENGSQLIADISIDI